MFGATVLLWLCNCLLVAGRSARPRIMGGEETSVDEYPFMVGYERWRRFECGGSIVSVSWAMTAAHCVRGNEQAGEIILRVGSSNRESGGWVIEVDKFVTYPTRMANDIALLHVKSDFPIGPNVQEGLSPMEVPRRLGVNQSYVVRTLKRFSDTGTVDHLPYSGRPKPNQQIMTVVTLAQYYLVGCHNGSAIGWGKQSPYEDSPEKLRKTTLLLLDPSECKYAVDFNWEDYVDTFYCARPKHADNDVCQGDSGSPFVKGTMQHGIVSRGQCSGKLTGRIVLTNIYYYREWIEKVTQE